MKLHLTVIIGALALTIPDAAHAAKPGKGKAANGEERQMPPRRVMKLYDANSNGVIDPGSETEAVRKGFETKPAMKHFDTNKDGKLEDSEIAAIKPHVGKGGKGGKGAKKKNVA